MSQQKVRRDFSDIDHLDRATESFLREQRKALEGYRPPRARRNRRRTALDFHRLTKVAAIAAVFAVIVGTVIFAGLRFGERGNELRQPEETSQAAVTETEPAETTTAEAVTEVTAEQTSLPTTVSTKVTTARTTGSEMQKSSSLPTEPSSTSSASASSTTSAEQRAAAANSASRTSATSTLTTASTTRSTTTSTLTAKRTTAPTTVSTTRTTVSTTRTTTRTTSTSTSTSTSTTAAAKAIITITGVSVGGWEDYNNHEGVIHYVTINVRNDGNATLSGSQRLSIKCDGSSIIHASCTTGNTTSIIMYNGETLYVPYNGRLAPGASDTIVMRVIAKSMFLDCTY